METRHQTGEVYVDNIYFYAGGQDTAALARLDSSRLPTTAGGT